MKIDSYLKKYRGEEIASARSSISNERQELLQQFLDKLNDHRKQDNFPPLTGKALAMKLSHIPTSDLWAFYRLCEGANHFSKFFWYSLKAK